MVNQYTSSVTEIKLIPRQSPQSPPRFEMKSSQVILWDRSNSGEIQTCIELGMWCSKTEHNTKSVSNQRQLGFQSRCSPRQCPFRTHCSTGFPPLLNQKSNQIKVLNIFNEMDRLGWETTSVREVNSSPSGAALPWPGYTSLVGPSTSFVYVAVVLP